MATSNQEVRAFTMDPALLYSVICNQSGTAGKAFLEGVMNSIDAGSSRVCIDVDADGFRIFDDGKGFESKQVIIDFFGTFGKPHAEGDSVYGRYRMGRGQLMSFGHNVWRSGDFRMEVDIKNKGLDYILTEVPKSESLAGCEIVVKWYDKPIPSELDAIHREIKEMVAYAQIPVIYNGKQINTLPEDAKWDIVTEDAYIKTRDVGGLTVYNLGVMVRTYGNHHFGVGGIVVSRKQLQVNFARNEILLNQCKAWKEISKSIKSITVSNIANKKTRITDDERIAIGRMLLAGELSPGDTVREAKLIKNAKGSFTTLDALLNKAFTVGNVISFAESGNQLAEMIHARGLAFIISDTTFRYFDAHSPSEFFDAVDRIIELRIKELIAQYPNGRGNYEHYRDYGRKLRAAFTSFEVLKSEVVDNHTIIDEKDLNAREKIGLSAIKSLCRAIPRLSGLRELSVSERKLKVGVSESAEAWTNGSSYIAVHRKLLEEVARDGYRGMLRVAGVLVHEYLHISTSQGSHIHDHDFYENWHNIMLSQDYYSIGRIIESTILVLAKSYRELGKAPVRNLALVEDVMAKTDSTVAIIDESEFGLAA